MDTHKQQLGFHALGLEAGPRADGASHGDFHCIQDACASKGKGGKRVSKSARELKRRVRDPYPRTPLATIAEGEEHPQSMPQIRATKRATARYFTLPRSSSEEGSVLQQTPARCPMPRQQRSSGEGSVLLSLRQDLIKRLTRDTMRAPGDQGLDQRQSSPQQTPARCPMQQQSSSEGSVLHNVRQNLIKRLTRDPKDSSAMRAPGDSEFRESLCDERLDDGLDSGLRALTPPRDSESAGQATGGGTQDAEFYRRSAIAQEVGAREVNTRNRGSRVAQRSERAERTAAWLAASMQAVAVAQVAGAREVNPRDRDARDFAITYPSAKPTKGNMLHRAPGRAAKETANIQKLVANILASGGRKLDDLEDSRAAREGTHEEVYKATAQAHRESRAGRASRRARERETAAQTAIAVSSVCDDGEDVPVSLLWCCMLEVAVGLLALSSLFRFLL